MIGGKSYLLCQVWLIPVVNYGLEALLRAQSTIPQDVKSFLPGLSVGLSHLGILFLAVLNLPSLSTLMFNKSVAGKRRTILKALDREGNTPEHEATLRRALELLDLAELNNYDIEINAAHAMHNKEMSTTDEK